MSRYADLARRHWERHAPIKLAELTDPDSYFATLGEQAETQVTDLATRLAGPDPTGEDYLTKAGRLKAARAQAEEIVLSDLVWSTLQPILAEAREEWDQTRTPDSWLAEWAERVERHPDQEPATDELADLAREWALTPRFLSGLLTTPSPRQYLKENDGILREAANTRFLRQHQSKA